MGTSQIFLGNVGVPSSLGLTPSLEGSQEAELVVFVLVPQEHVCWSNNNTRHLFCMASCVGKTLLFFFLSSKRKESSGSGPTKGYTRPSGAICLNPCSTPVAELVVLLSRQSARLYLFFLCLPLLQELELVLQELELGKRG